MSVKFADGSPVDLPVTNLLVMGTPAGDYYGYLATRRGTGIRLLTFDGPGKYCVWIAPGQDVGAVGPGYPQFTLSSSGELILNSDNNSSYPTTNPDCAIALHGDSLIIDVTLPALTEVSGYVVHKNGTPCSAQMDAVKGPSDGRHPYLTAGTDSQGGPDPLTFTFFLTPGTWKLSAIDDSNEYGPTVPDTKLTVGNSPIQNVKVLCGGTGAG